MKHSNNAEDSQVPEGQLPELNNDFGDVAMTGIAKRMLAVDTFMNKPGYYSERIKIMARELMKGKSPTQIADAYCKEWDITPRTLKGPYMDDARAFIATEVLTEENDIRTDLLAKYQNLYRIHMEKERYRDAHKVLDSITNLIKGFGPSLQIFNAINTVELVEVRREDDE